ncbi:AAA family ATPase [uncultured Holdemanella sp.]|uniref:AAA family ATPase n=1 Tax=uncultured Holdemanella sp. TaxID=1763549 RepID=UPI0035A6EA45
MNPEGGTRNYNFSTYDSYSSLHEHMRLWRSRKPDWMYFLRAESFYNVATKEMEYRGVFSERYHDQSHGQSFFSVLMKQTNKNGLYLLDEPEAALSCQNQLALLYLIQSCVKQNCQFIIATHSPILLGFPGAQILSFDEDKVEEVDYKSTSSYQTMKLFLDRYDYFVEDIKENEI